MRDISALRSTHLKSAMAGLGLRRVGASIDAPDQQACRNPNADEHKEGHAKVAEFIWIGAACHEGLQNDPSRGHSPTDLLATV